MMFITNKEEISSCHSSKSKVYSKCLGLASCLQTSMKPDKRRG